MKPGTNNKLAAQLQAIGFPAEVEMAIALHALFSPAQFEITCPFSKGTDQYRATAYCKADSNDLICTHYDVSLRRYSALPSQSISGISVQGLQESMQSINWKGLLATDGLAFTDPTNLDAISGVLVQLSKLSEVEQGAKFATELKLRFWEGTSLQQFIGALSQARSAIEISQRYFLFEGDSPILLEEAFRFLNHRWQEKIWNAVSKKSSKIQVTDERLKRLGKKGSRRQRTKE